MGAFFLVCEPEQTVREQLFGALDRSFSAQGFQGGIRFETGPVAGMVYGKLSGAAPQFHLTDDDRFVALCGTVLLDGAIGSAVARMLARKSVISPSDWQELVGSFCAIRGDGREVHLNLDPLAVFKVYRTRDLRVFSSSFLAVAQALGSISPNPQGVYEYVHQEATFGGETIANEILGVKPGEQFVLGSTPRLESAGERPRVEMTGASNEEYRASCLLRLREIYGQIGRAFGDCVDTALSGGYDSRLTLALLWEQQLSPRIHVYGASTSSDVSIARAIAAGEGFSLSHIDKGAMPEPSAAEYVNVVERNFLAFDGWPASGIFDPGADLGTRLERASGGALMLNGGGGEIFRNFFYLPDRSYSSREIVWSFFSRYSPHWCTPQFDEERYLSALTEKLSESVGGEGSLSRSQVEYAYPAFRCNYWMGRNNSVNSRIGWALTPFVDPQLVELCAGIPLKLKEHGRFEADLIRTVSPDLARYESDYGHAFDGPPPLKRIVKDHLTLVRPPRMRRYTYRLRHRRQSPRSKWLRDENLSKVMDASMPRMSDFFHVSRINDPQAYGRIATLEYLFDSLSQ